LEQCYFLYRVNKECRKPAKQTQKYSNSYFFYNNIYMKNHTNKLNLFLGVGLGSFFILLPNVSENLNNLVINQALIISLLIYSFLSYLAINAYLSNKIAGLMLLFSISFLSPNLYKNFIGELYPITYLLFFSYYSYYLGKKIFKTWKSSL